MKKASGLTAILLTAVLICALFAGCAKDNSNESDTPANTEDTADNAVDTKDTETEAESSDTLAGLELVPEEIETERLLMMNTRASKFLKSKSYVDGEVSLTWYKFYNACVRREIDVTSEKPAEYINECLAFFEENGLDDEAAQANALISAAKAKS
ncbi:MAG: hypothetical protein IJS45_07305 [Clostridia bacterium]|nr:hypothetical protein [Clostridia bacterium]